MEHKTAEQEARDILERMGVANAQQFSSGDLVELANLINRVKKLEKNWKKKEDDQCSTTHSYKS